MNGIACKIIDGNWRPLSKSWLDVVERVHLVKPLEYLPFLKLMEQQERRWLKTLVEAVVKSGHLKVKTKLEEADAFCSGQDHRFLKGRRNKRCPRSE